MFYKNTKKWKPKRRNKMNVKFPEKILVMENPTTHLSSTLFYSLANLK